MIIKLVRHGQSESNLNGYDNAAVADSKIPITSQGRLQAFGAGEKIGGPFINDALIYCSPYTRTRQTLEYALKGSGLTPDITPVVYEDPRLREIEHGYSTFEEQETLWNTHGQFYYRFRGGESPADGYDRSSNFIESMNRQIERKKKERVLIVTHGLMIRCIVMRFLHLTVEQFETIKNPWNGAIITIAHKTLLSDPQFINGKWGVTGLTLQEIL